MPIAASELGFAYVPRRAVLSGVSLTLRAGALTAIVGPNGAGKSTLLRLLLGVLRPTAGRVSLDDQEVWSMPHRARARRIAYIPQRTSPAFGFTVAQCVRMGRLAHGLPDDGAAAGRALDRVGLTARRDDVFDVLSAGQQQRAILARALAQLDSAEPGPILLADEPASALDPRQSLEAMAILRERAAAGVAVVVVLHDLTLAARFCDDAVVLTERGGIAAFGPAASTLTPDVLNGVFGVRFEREGDSLLASLPAH